MTRWLIPIAGTLLLVGMAGADFGHTASSATYPMPPVINSASGLSCYQREITQLRLAANATLQSNQDLEMGAAQAFDRLAELGQNC